MNQILAKTLGGLSKEYYFRQFVFGLLLSVIFYMAMPYPSYKAISFILINTLLYPYSRFFYEAIISFIFGENTFIVSVIPMLFIKVVSMLVCLLMAIFIAPLGLLYLYFYNSKS